MPKVLLISGSPRNGNTNLILKTISEAINYSKEIILLKDKNIKHCIGCLSCHNKLSCVIKDDMDEIREKVIEADILVIGTPNYFDNVSGLLKNFIDRTHPFYKPEMLKGKKLILIMVGGGGIEGTKKHLNETMYGFIKYHKLDLVNSYSFKALKQKEVEESFDYSNQIREITEKINSL